MIYGPFSQSAKQIIMPKPYNLSPIDVNFFNNAAYRVNHQIEINCSVTRMMEALKDNQQWMQWASPMKHAEWTSEPGVVNCNRDVHLSGGILLRETFFEWQENKRVSFYVYEASAPGLKSFGEDHQITVLGDDRVLLNVTVALEFKSLAIVLGPLVYLALKAMVPKMLNNYKNMLENNC